jgi:ferredoxin
MQPDVFAFDDADGPSVRVERPEGRQAEDARDAAATCPGKAISLSDD